MQRTRNSRSPRATARTQRPLELSQDHAFVLHLDVRARPPRHMMGRIEHVTSGQVAHVTSLRGLVAFMAQVLREQTRGEHGTAYATLVQQPDRSDSAPFAPFALEDDVTRSTPEPIRRGRKKGTVS